VNKILKAILGDSKPDCPEKFDAKVDEVIKIFKRASKEELKAWKFPVDPETWGRKLSEKERDVLLQSSSDQGR
tara:strand:+ start:21285 stop:21503 length:219 start_codon:yes stop_codon:yes gene_type:complete